MSDKTRETEMISSSGKPAAGGRFLDNIPYVLLAPHRYNPTIRQMISQVPKWFQVLSLCLSLCL